MQVRQIYADETSRTRAAFGSVGTLPKEHMLVLFFNVVSTADNANRKSLQLTLVYDTSLQKYVDETDPSTYAEIAANTISLTFSNNGTSVTNIYAIDKDQITLVSSSASPAVTPSITVNGTQYTAIETGKFAEYRHSKFIDDEGKVEDADGNPISSDNKCTYANDIEAVRQFLLQHLAVMKHELWYNYEYGLPLLQKGLTKAMVDAEVALIISECPGVDYIMSFNSYVDNHNYHLSFSIMTLYGKLDMIDTL